MIKIERVLGRGHYDTEGNFIFPEPATFEIQGEIHPAAEKLTDEESGQRIMDCLLYTSPSPRD